MILDTGASAFVTSTSLTAPLGRTPIYPNSPLVFPRYMILDTGANTFVTSPSLAAALGRATFGELHCAGVGAKVSVFLVAESAPK
jgi:hypothetical protein